MRHGLRSCFVIRWKVPTGLPFLFEEANLAFFESSVPPLFHDLRAEAMRKDRHLDIDFARLVIEENKVLILARFDGE